MSETKAVPMIPMIQRRRIEAEILGEVYRAAIALVGADTAQQIIGNAVRASAVAQGRHFAAQARDGTTLASFADIQKHWTAENALEIVPERRDETHFEFRVTRCRYAEMYKDMGLEEIGQLLSCNRDRTFCEGYDSRLKLTRTQTIMSGAAYCDFKFRFNAEPTSD